MILGVEVIYLECAFGNSRNEICKSFKYVITAINYAPDLKMNFPLCHDKYKDVSEEFKDISKPILIIV